MKRCPQCEFIYEDDQSLCDMDGVLLVFDSRKLPNMHALATVSAPPMPDRAQRRSRMVPAFATLILMLVIASVYYVTAVRTTADNLVPTADIPTAQAEAPVVVPEPTPESVAIEAPVAAPTPERGFDTEKRETHSTTTAPKAAVAPAKKSVTEPAKPEPAKPEPKKDDSKVGSILKKTGKILKKPFKF
jgi:cell division septation protein DedD